MKTYLLNIAEIDTLGDIDRDDIVEEVLNTGAIFSSLEKAQDLARNYVTELYAFTGDDVPPTLQWSEVQLSAGQRRRWNAMIEGVVEFRVWEYELDDV